MPLSDVSPHDDAELLERHALAGPGVTADAALERFRTARPALIRMTDSMLAVFRARLRGNPIETEERLAAVKRRTTAPWVELERRPSVNGTRVLGSHRVWHSVWYVMTGLVLGILGLLIGEGRATHGPTHAPRGMSTYVTANGERANITLPDGSIVALNVASRLDVPADFAVGHHTVHLLGEALFTVPQHEAVPFTVVAGGTVARVLGTSFVVRHYGTDSTATVAVREGKVEVGSIVVTAARLLAIGPRGVTHWGTADAAQFGFATGTLHLSSMPLSQAVPELDRWYAAEIRFADSSFARIPIEGVFTAGSITDLADHLGWILRARVVRDGRVLTLFPETR